MSEKMTELEAAKARIAQLEDALEKCSEWLEDDGRNIHIQNAAAEAIYLALSVDPSEWRERVKREAQAELMEQWAEHPICDQFPAFRDKYLDLASELRKGAGDE